MIGLISIFSVFSTPQPPAPAADIGQCPATADINSTPYTDPDLPAPYGEGYQYTASANGNTWTGQTAGTSDDYLAPEYELKPEEINERDGKTHCDYGGKRVIKNGEVADPYLRLTKLE